MRPQSDLSGGWGGRRVPTSVLTMWKPPSLPAELHCMSLLKGAGQGGLVEHLAIIRF